MRAITAIAASLTFVLATACSDERDFAPEATGELTDSNGAVYLAHEVVFMPAAGVNADRRAKVLESLGAEIIDEGAPLSTALGYIRLRLPVGVSADQAISTLKRSGIAESAERNYVSGLDLEPNDPALSDLWGLNSIEARAAWGLGTGNDEIVVAVLDTGVDRSHPELQANMWTNLAETPGNGQDDDGNGFVDDYHGWHFDSVTGTSGNDPDDIHGHGTHVSGTIGAAGDNGIGIVGVNWTTRIMAINVFFDSAAGPRASLADIVQGIGYATSNGAKVLNASLGGAYEAPQYLLDAIEAFGDSGGLFVAAAGNSALNNDVVPHSPANADVYNVVSVAALAYNDNTNLHELADGPRHGWNGGSNYGATTVDLGAPGHSIYSTLPGAAYAAWSGTSMAAPHVAGAAALFLSIYPETPVADLRSALLTSVDPVAELSGKTVTGGKLNLYRMIADFAPPPSEPLEVAAAPGDHRDITVSWQTPESGDADSFRVNYQPVGGSALTPVVAAGTASSAALTNLGHGVTYAITVTAISAHGIPGPASNEVTATASDGIAPPAVIDLIARGPRGLIVPTLVTQSSGEISDYWRAHNAADGDPLSGWVTPGRQVQEREELSIDVLWAPQEGEAGTAGPQLAEEVALLPSTVYPEFFPIDFDVEVSQDGEQFEAIGYGRGVTAMAGEWQRFRFSPRTVSAVRLIIHRSYQHRSNRFFTGLA